AAPFRRRLGRAVGQGQVPYFVEEAQADVSRTPVRLVVGQDHAAAVQPQIQVNVRAGAGIQDRGAFQQRGKAPELGQVAPQGQMHAAVQAQLTAIAGQAYQGVRRD